MAASVNDYFQKTGGASSLVNTPKVTVVRAAAGTTLTVDNCNWDQTTGKRFATFQVNTSGVVVAGTETIWKGVVTSSTSIGSLARVAGAADTGNAIGDYVMLLPASDWANQLVAGLLVEHTQAGLHTLTPSSTMTSPKVITSLNDTNGNELAKVTATTSAVNEVTIANAATGNGPTISATGDDTNIDLKLATKGTGLLKSNGNPVITRLGLGTDTGAATLTNAYVDHATVTATSHGGEIELQWGGLLGNVNSGSDRTFDIQVLCDGVTTGITPSTLNYDSPLITGVTTTLSYGYVHKQTGLAAGSHTWKIQYKANANTAVALGNNFLRVCEIG